MLLPLNTPQTQTLTPMSPNTLSAKEVTEEIRRIQEQHGKNLEVRVKQSLHLPLHSNRVVEIKYRSSGSFGVSTPYIELVIA